MSIVRTSGRVLLALRAEPGHFQMMTLDDELCVLTQDIDEIIERAVCELDNETATCADKVVPVPWLPGNV